MPCNLLKATLLLGLLAISAVSCRKEAIPSMNIIKESPIGWDTKESCLVVYSKGSSTDTLKAAIKCRGGMSSRYDKHSFSLELGKKYKFHNLPYDDDWVLNANYIDKTFMRHKICYDLFREMNPANVASPCSYVNLNINDNYAGLYVIMQEINAKSAELDKKDPRSMLFKDPPVFYKERLKNVQDSLNYYQQKFPKIHDKDQTEYIERFKDFLFNSSDSEFINGISKWIDIKNVIDWHLLLLFTNNSDGIMKNFYLYKKDEATPFRIAIWDYDHSFGRDGDNELNLNNELNFERSILLKRLMNIAGSVYPERLKNRWKELRKKNIISLENFKSHVNRNDEIIKKVITRNFKKWPVDDKWYYDANSYDQEIELMICFVEQRIRYLDGFFEM